MKRLLVGLDTTAESDFVLARAIELARGLEAKIRLVRAVPPSAAVPVPLVGRDATSATAAVRAAEGSLTDRMREVPEELRDGVVVELGGPAEVICAVARAYDADLVVIGAHRHGVVARMLGTTAAKVVERAHRPVIVVRPEPAREAPPIEAPRSGRAHDDHVLLEAATLVGATSGAVLGAVGGPPGAVIGGVVGAAIGMVAGQVLDEEDARRDAHERDLDEAIGVTSANLGAREAAANGLEALIRARRSGTEIEADAALRAGAPPRAITASPRRRSSRRPA
jgi:nucleotide-binding universal stress UspA family protein